MNKKKAVEPLDPTQDFEDMINDATGLSGITKDKTKRKADLKKDDKADITSSSNTRVDKNSEISTTKDTKPVESPSKKREKKSTSPPNVRGEQSISGDMPTPDSDDDALKAAQDMGIALEEDSEHPKELEIGDDVDKAEEYRRTH